MDERREQHNPGVSLLDMKHKETHFLYELHNVLKIYMTGLDAPDRVHVSWLGARRGGSSAAFLKHGMILNRDRRKLLVGDLHLDIVLAQHLDTKPDIAMNGKFTIVRFWRKEEDVDGMELHKPRPETSPRRRYTCEWLHYR